MFCFKKCQANLSFLTKYRHLSITATQTKTRIKEVKARQIYDSRGNPTLEVDVITDDGSLFRSGVPSGASTGKYEALELRDNNVNDWHGKGVINAINNVNNIISPNIIGMNPINQRDIDKYMIEELDGTKNEFGYCKANLGGNAILGVSTSICKAAAASLNIPLYQYIAELAGNNIMKLPVPSFNVINGGSHAGNKLPFQEFMIQPIYVDSFKNAMKAASETYHSLKKILLNTFGQDSVNVGDEGGFAPNVSTPDECLDILSEAIKLSGYEGIIKIGIDPASSEFCINNIEDVSDGIYKYDLNTWYNDANPNIVDSSGLSQIYKDLLSKYPNIVSLEDSHSENDWNGFKQLTHDIGNNITCIGDDILVTNPTRIKRAINENTVNGLLLKINQIGTITETIEAIKLAKNANWAVMTSHRSGETEDAFISDMTVGLCCGLIKSGAPARSERLAKYNQLLRIEEDIGNNSIYAADTCRFPCKPY